MSKYCIKCGTKLAYDDLFCGICGVKQESTETPVEVPTESKAEKNIDIKTETVVAESVVESTFPILETNNKRSKKSLILAIGGITVICIITLLVIFMFSRSKGLVALDEVEQKLNEAYTKVWGGYGFGFNGVTEFEIKNVDENTHDQTFSCFVTPSADGVTGLSIMGLVKDGQIVQMQSVYIGSADAFVQSDTDTQTNLLTLTIFPISIFKEDIDTVQEFVDFLRNMDAVNSITSGLVNKRIVEGDIEYTFVGGSENNIVMSSFNIRYLPAFSSGYFEDDNNDEVEDDIVVDSEVEVKDFISKIQGYWVSKSGSSCIIMYIKDKTITDGYYRSESFPTETITDVTKMNNNEFKIETYSSATYLFEQVFPEMYTTYTFSSMNDFKKEMIVSTKNGEKIKYTFAGNSYESAEKICETMLRFEVN